MKIRYNAPVTLSFALLSTLVLVLGQLTGGSVILSFFSIPAKGMFDAANPVHYLRLFTHIAGHANWLHLLSNFSFILLLGPILEEKYGKGPLLIMIVTTALVTGVLNVIFLPTGLLGASGIVFMMILLISFTNIKKGEIPLTFILVVFLFLAKEIINAFQENTVSEFAHIAGGICGSLFGFFQTREPSSSKKDVTPSIIEEKKE